METSDEQKRDLDLKRWNSMSSWYEQFEEYALQSTITCLAMTNAAQCKSIVEVGCGPGFHSEFIAKNYLSNGGLLVSCDFSTSMIKLLNNRYAQSEFLKIEGNTVHVDHLTDFVNSNELFVWPALGEGNIRKVIGCVADNMRLPFPDQHFDCYISNLSLMIVPNYLRQISECYRVLKRGSKACFTVWGRPENTVQFIITRLASERLGRPPVVYNMAHDNFHINKNKDKVL